MVGPITRMCLAGLLFTTLRFVWRFHGNLQKARKSGLPYVVGPFFPIGTGWMILAEVLGPLLLKIPVVQNWDWLQLIDRQVSWNAPRVSETRHGDTMLVVTPFIIYLKTSNAELGSQVTTRKADFPKPVEKYKIVDLFGRSILTQEGQEWRRHRKIVGPSFSEKSNRLVFEESVRQAEGMMALWSSKADNVGKSELKVEDTSHDAATLSLHVICAAGFGVPQLWPHEGEEKLCGNGITGFSDHSLSAGHTMSFKDGLSILLKQLMWFALLPRWALHNSPFKIHKTAALAFTECMAYFGELVDIKKKQLYLGESNKGTMDLLGPMIRASGLGDPDTKSQPPPSASLTRSEILGNSFIFLFAGHETTANSIHYSILQMALLPATQRRMQADIDRILETKKPAEFDYHTDMPRLYNSMVGAILHEELRVIPAVLNIPKITAGDQVVTIDGKQHLIPDDTFVHLNVVGTNRNPRYWPVSPHEFIPERWLPKSHESSLAAHSETEDMGEKERNGSPEEDGLDNASFETSSLTSLMKPIKGSYIPFSEGSRACPGKRFAQVEATAVLSTLFQNRSVELDVSTWASDAEVEAMNTHQKKEVYEKARERARNVILRSEQMITLQMRAGDHVPIRFVQRGRERFAALF